MARRRRRPGGRRPAGGRDDDRQGVGRAACAGRRRRRRAARRRGRHGQDRRDPVRARNDRSDRRCGAGCGSAAGRTRRALHAARRKHRSARTAGGAQAGPRARHRPLAGQRKRPRRPHLHGRSATDFTSPRSGRSALAKRRFAEGPRREGRRTKASPARAPEPACAASTSGWRKPWPAPRRTIAHVTGFHELDAVAFADLASSLRRAAEAEGRRFPFDALLVRAAALALRKHPIFNSSLDEERGEIVVHR